MGKFVNLVGLKFGMWEVMEYMGRSKWRCNCECGTIKEVGTSQLKKGLSTNCGCKRRKHGQEGTRLYRVWGHMKERCFNKNNKSYKDYGERGVIVVNEWLDFNNFYNWAHNNGYEDGLSIDRIDVNGNYSPNNCRFITMKEQQRNKRNSKFVTINNITKTASEWAELVNLDRHTILYRINRGEQGVQILRRGRKGGGLCEGDYKGFFDRIS